MIMQNRNALQLDYSRCWYKMIQYYNSTFACWCLNKFKLSLFGARPRLWPARWKNNISGPISATRSLQQVRASEGFLPRPCVWAKATSHGAMDLLSIDPNSLAFVAKACTTVRTTFWQKDQIMNILSYPNLNYITGSRWLKSIPKETHK